MNAPHEGRVDAVAQVGGQDHHAVVGLDAVEQKHALRPQRHLLIARLSRELDALVHQTAPQPCSSSLGFEQEQPKLAHLCRLSHGENMDPTGR